MQAAEGWLELGDWQSANDELEEITPTMRAHRDVLKMRYRIYIKAKKWLMVKEVLHSLSQMPPGITAIEMMALLQNVTSDELTDKMREGLIGSFAAMEMLNKQYKIKPYNPVIVQGVLERLMDKSIPLENIVEWAASLSPIE